MPRNQFLHGLTLDDPRRSFVRVMERLSHARRQWQVFRDFCEVLAITYANVAPHPLHEKREARYLELIKTYEPDERAALAFGNACVVSEMHRKGFDDVLGSLFMEMDLGSHWHGQFFTPYCMSSMMARMTLDAEHARALDIVRWHEPACGAGAMIIAVAETLLSHQINPQQRMHTEAVDIDSLCVHMAVIQLSVLGLPAIVWHGNTLSGERWDRWCTPAHVLGFWDGKLRRADARMDTLSLNQETIAADADESVQIVTIKQSEKESVTTGNEVEQLALF